MMDDPTLCSFTKPIQDFYMEFSGLQIVQAEIRRAYGDGADEIVEALRTGQPLGDWKDEVYYLISDLISNESTVADKITAMGDIEFNIAINKFGNAYWVSAIEFDCVGLFTSIKDAKIYAHDAYESFIEAMDERAEE